MKLSKKIRQHDVQGRANRGIPLTYYRAGSKQPSRSPFEKRAQTHGAWHKFFVRLVDLLIISAILFCLIYSLIVQPNSRVNISDSSYHGSTVYKKEIDTKLKRLTSRTKITLDEQGLIESLQGRFPEITSGTVELPLFDEKPTLHLNISPPAFFFNSGETTYIVDVQGKAVAKSSQMPNIRNLPIVNDQTGFRVAPGEQVLGATGVSFIQTIISQNKKAKIPISSLVLPKLAQELDLRTTDRPYYVKFYLGGDVDVQIGQYLASRHQFDTTGDQPAEYLDVRVQGKVFYK